MTKEELEKEADSWGFRKKYTYGYTYTYEQIKNAYICGAEPREKRIAELERQLAISEHDREHNDYELTEVYKKVAELEKENAELKKEWQEQVQKATDEGYARTLQTIQLTKAKKIIQRLVTKLYKYTRFTDDVLAEAEQFLKE